jgi:cold shock CspA family protein
MSSDTKAATTTIGRMTGMIKWFNSKSGFGFITVYSQNEHKGTDIFVHYSAIRSSNSQYKYLVQGEYVDFDLASSENNDHKFIAQDVAGVFDGPIMCETRKLAMIAQSEHAPAMQHQDRVYKTRDDGAGRTASRPARPHDSSRASSRQHTQHRTSTV